MGETVLYESHGQVRLVTVNCPAKMNAMDFDANQRFIAAMRAFDADDDARVAVVTGAGRDAFCAGADLKTYTMAFARTPAPEFHRRYTMGYGFGGITRGLTIHKPILAAINGYAMSGGLEIALACDLRFCSPNAAFALQDVKWGFHACDGALVRLPHIIGLGHAMEMFLSGQRFDSQWAYRVGLVNQVIEQDRLLSEVMAYAAAIAEHAPLALRLGKQVMLDAIGRPAEDGLIAESRSFRALGESADLEEGTRAFAERRKAQFKGA